MHVALPLGGRGSKGEFIREGCALRSNPLPIFKEKRPWESSPSAYKAFLRGYIGLRTSDKAKRGEEREEAITTILTLTNV